MAGADWGSTIEAALEGEHYWLGGASAARLSGMSLPLLVANGCSGFYHSSLVHFDITRVGIAYN